MNQGIVVCTWSGGEESSSRLLKSLEGVPYPIVVVVNNAFATPTSWLIRLGNDYSVISLVNDSYELGAIKTVLENTDFDEFVFFQDTFEVVDQSLFDILFKEYEGRSVAYNPYFQMYFGKFRRVILERMAIPEVTTKAEAVRQEDLFTKAYRELDPDTAIFNEHFIDQNYYGHWDEMFGRKNLVMSDQYVIKRKGTWDSSQI